MSIDPYRTDEALQLATEVTASLEPNGDRSVDEEAGDLLADGLHAARVGRVVIVSTAAAQPGAVEHKSADAASKEIATLVAGA